MSRLGQYLHAKRMKVKHLKGTASLEHMAGLVGCAKSYLSDVENNVTIPSLGMAAKIAKAYKTTLNQMAEKLKETP